jgi:hypothetical protein
LLPGSQEGALDGPYCRVPISFPSIGGVALKSVHKCSLDSNTLIFMF